MDHEIKQVEVEAYLYSKQEPTPQQQERLKQFLADKYQKEVGITWKKDDTVADGFRMEVGTSVYKWDLAEIFDWTPEGRSRQLKQSIRAAISKNANVMPMIREAVQNIDYAPTFLDLAGAPIPADIQGVSLLPLLRGEHPKKWRNDIYYHYHEYPAEHAVKRHYGIRTERYKLMHFYNDIDVWELYDLQTDPNELHNLYGQPGMEKVTKQLMKRLKQLQIQYDDPILEKYPIK